MTRTHPAAEAANATAATTLADTSENAVLERRGERGEAVHRVEVAAALGAPSRFDCAYRGEHVFRSHQPVYDGARWLLDRGIADPGDRIETWRGGTLCMSALVGRAAEFKVREGERGYGLARYVPFDRDAVVRAEAA